MESSTLTAKEAIDAHLDSTIVTTTTKGGWCLRAGLTHVATCDTKMLELIQRHGVPSYYDCVNNGGNTCRHAATQDIKDPQTCFQSLCRIVAGQFVSGASAQAAYQRLVKLSDNSGLAPQTILEAAQADEEWHSTAGITRAKARSLVDLATRFSSNELSDDLLLKLNEEEVRKALLQVRGIGPWSCDIFLQFYLEQSNILPLGDLGVRKGIAAHFGVDAAKNEKATREKLQPFEPYLSLVTYYMWRVADTDVKKNPKEKTSKASSTKKKQTKRNSESLDGGGDEASTSPLRKRTAETPSKRRRTSPRKMVTP